MHLPWRDRKWRGGKAVEYWEKSSTTPYIISGNKSEITGA
jgi:hypothetical protein